MRGIIRTFIFLSLMVFFADEPSAQQVNFCEFLSIEKDIDKKHRRIEKIMSSNMLLIDKYPDSTLEHQLLGILESIKDPFKSEPLFRPSLLFKDAIPCANRFFDKNVFVEFEDLLARTESLLNKVVEISRELRSKIPNFRVDHFKSKSGGFQLFNIEYAGKEYKCIELDPGDPSYELQFVYSNKKKAGHSFEKVLRSSKSTVALFNAGIFNRKYEPEGLLITNGKVEKGLNNEIDSFGNFYLQPNGVFYIKKDLSAHVSTREGILELQQEEHLLHATQSGPMLVIDGKIHPLFNPGSNNKYIRNGVGVRKNGHIVFIFSERPVNLYSFASVFRDFFGCSNALYLDGAISHLFSPHLPNASIPRRRFGPLISISINED